MDDLAVYNLIGEAGFTELVSRFYAQVPASPILGKMYPKDDFEGAQERLRLFLIQRFGGPSTYSEQRGHPRLRMRHFPFAVDDDARQEWLNLMTRALDEMKFAPDIDAILRKYFADTAMHMMNR